MKTSLIAPCGMNCSLCLGYLRDKNKCSGCRNISNENKQKTRIRCIIKNCEQLKKNKWKYCSDKCEKFPCKRLKNLDKRYRNKYDMSMIENLESIKKLGIRKFIEKEKKRWIKGGQIFCVHKKQYYPIK
ncbi:MAG: DUF3795 domain-containing protein [Planctomycetes bacterium]|nr:DUF3795 domain-containing protein [Planctomycetota bacterium]